MASADCAPLPELNSATVTWEWLEENRYQSLGLSNKYSRHFNVLRQSLDGKQPAAQLKFVNDKVATQGLVPDGGRTDDGSTTPRSANAKSNSIAPFYTVEKPTCGYFFSRSTDNRKIKFGIPPANHVKWRNFVAGPSSGPTA